MNKGLNVNQIEKQFARRNWTSKDVAFMMCKTEQYVNDRRNKIKPYSLEDVILLADVFEKPIERFFNERLIKTNLRRYVKSE